MQALSRVFLGFEQVLLRDEAGPLLYLEGLSHPDDDDLEWKDSHRGQFLCRDGGVCFGRVKNHEVIIENLPESASEGSGYCFEVTAASRADKRARVKIVPDQEPVSLKCEQRLRALSHVIWGHSDWSLSRHIYDPWRAHEHDDAIDEARVIAGSLGVSLKGGGLVYFEPTRAVLSVDIDSANNQFKGPKALREARINEIALKATIRHCRLMGMGGRIMIDLIGKKPNRLALKTVFESLMRHEKDAQWGGFGPFGSLEFTRPWRTTPQIIQANNLTGRLLTSLFEQLRSTDPGLTQPIVILPALEAHLLSKHMKASLHPLAARLIVKSI
jgi:hypothetical protein